MKRVSRQSQRDRILALLRDRGPEGISNIELNVLCFRYGARIWELRRIGFEIDTIRIGDGMFRFVFRGEPSEAAGDPRPDRPPHPPASSRTARTLPLFSSEGV
jgi:Helix-turn-helix domain